MAESPAKDKNYNLITVLQQSLENVWTLSSYIDDAENEGDDELVNLFKQAQGRNQEAPTTPSVCSASGFSKRAARARPLRGRAVSRPERAQPAAEPAQPLVAARKMPGVTKVSK